MKKRLLSAALALAIVLTLLPVSAFAVSYDTSSTPTNPNEITYTVGTGSSAYNRQYYWVNPANGAVNTVTVTRAATSSTTTGQVEGKWYWLANQNPDANGVQYYYEAKSGIVVGTGTSGQWYPSLADYTRTNPTTSEETLLGTTFTLLSDENSTLSDYSTILSKNFPTILNVDLNGHSLSLPNPLPDRLTSLTFTNKYGSKAASTVTALTTSRGGYNTNDGSLSSATASPSGLSVTATNVTIASLNLVGRANTVTLTNCAVTGGITMNGTYVSNANGVNAFPAQRLTATTTSVGGAVAVTGDSSAVNLTSVTGNQTLNVTGNGGTIAVSGASMIGAITSGAREKTGQYPSVTVSGGTVASIAQAAVAGNTNKIIISVSGSNTTVGSTGIDADYGTITVDQATVGDIGLDAGGLTIKGNYAKTGDITLGNTDTITLSISGTGLNIGDITSTNAKLNITGWPADRANVFGVLDLGSFGGHGVNGGTFDSSTDFDDPSNLGWFNANLQYYVTATGGKALYGKTELGDAISALAHADAISGTDIVILGQTSSSKIKLMNGDTEWAEIGFDADTGIILPERINMQNITSWIGENGNSVPAGSEQAILVPSGGGTVTLNSTAVSQDVTKLTNATPSKSTTVENQSVRVSFSGNTISLSGAVNAGAGGLAVIRLDLTTDVVKTDGSFLVLTDVPVVYNVANKTCKFDDFYDVSSLATTGAQIQNGALRLANGTIYTVNGSGLTVSASNLGLGTLSSGESIVATVGGSLSSWKQEQKDELIAQIEGGDFSYTGNRAMAEAINAAQATITSTTTVDNLVTQAQNYVWTNGNKYLNAQGQPNGLGSGDGSLTKHSGSISNPGAFSSDATTITTNYSRAYIVPYLVVNVTDYNQNGTLTATLTPYYRVDVSGASYDHDEYYTVQTGRALSALTGDMSTPITVEFNLSAVPFATAYMHQDGKYVYTPASGVWSINHAGDNGTLGTIVLNAVDGPISISSDISSRTPSILCKYDSLQAAVDDTIPGLVDRADPTNNTYDTITVGGTYTGSCSVNMTGTARTIKVKFLGNHDVVTGLNETDVQTTDGFNYTIQLKRDTVVNKTGNITINSVTGGTASVNVNPATAGQTVTITLTPAAGYVSSGVTVRDASNNAVSVVGSGNTFTFVMPSGSVTVTPAFTQAQATKTTVSVASNSMGNTTTTAAATNNQVDAGSVVGVTTYPASGYRTMGVNIATNGGATSAVRQGDNYFTFTVPANATAVTVTPVYDRDNGTKFSDVWSTEYYSDPVAWAVKNNITDGTSTYTFSPSNTCTRAQMVTFLWRAAGRPSVTGISNPFVDVSPTLTPGDYYSAILWAVSKGITNGVDPTHFGPSQTVTRAQAVTFLYRYEGAPAASTSSGFYDIPSTEYYAKAVSWAASKGITNGTSTYYFSPSAGCQRAQIVTFLYRDVNNIRA